MASTHQNLISLCPYYPGTCLTLRAPQWLLFIKCQIVLSSTDPKEAFLKWPGEGQATRNHFKKWNHLAFLWPVQHTEVLNLKLGNTHRPLTHPVIPLWTCVAHQREPKWYYLFQSKHSAAWPHSQFDRESMLMHNASWMHALTQHPQEPLACWALFLYCTK